MYSRGMVTGPMPALPSEAIRAIVQSVLKKYPGETFSTWEIEQLQKELFDEVKAAIEKEGLTFDPHHFSIWQAALWKELEGLVHRPTLMEHLLEDE